MLINKGAYLEILARAETSKAALVAVSKTKSIDAIRELYDLGQRDFGENYVQEMVDKQRQLPADIRWHFIGHLQTNKVKSIAPFAYLIQGVDSFRLLEEINRQAAKNNQTIKILLQAYIASEDTKFGLDRDEIKAIMDRINTQPLPNVTISGLMGMATLTGDTQQIKAEFQSLHHLFKEYPQLQILSMGMSSDYEIALEEGSNMIRVGSLIFGSRP